MDCILKAKLACLSTDEKPTSIPGYTDDLKYSVLWELDTDKKYYYTGNDWVEVGTGGGGSGEIILAAEQTETATNDGSDRFFYEPEINSAAFTQFVNTLSEDNVMVVPFAIEEGTSGETLLTYYGLDNGYYSWQADGDNLPFTFTIKNDGTDYALTLNTEEEGMPETLTMTYSIKIVPNE